MTDLRNPFRLRASEQIESDANFLRLFEPTVLSVLPRLAIWDRVLILRSAAGGGKTSILRVFEPNVLLTLVDLRHADEYSELFTTVRSLGAVDDEGPRVLGAGLSFARNYDSFASLPLPEETRRQLFLGLLNAQMVLAGLRAVTKLKRIRFPDDLSSLECSYDDDPTLPPEVRSFRDGSSLFEWATKIERGMYDALDRFRPGDAPGQRGHDRLLAPRMLRTGALKFDGRPIAEHVLVMMDDAQKLASAQRQYVMTLLAEDRAGVAVWVAERNQALSADELVGARFGRDVNSPIQLESYWRGRQSRFVTVLQRLADRRAASAADFDASSLSAFLQSAHEWASVEQASEVTAGARVRAEAAAAQRPIYSAWLASTAAQPGSSWEKAIGWERSAILIQRDVRKAQRTFDFVLEEDELERRDDSSVGVAAELFLSVRLKLPYYFGFDRLARLASSNIEQFLALAGDEFEEISAGAQQRGGSWRLSARRQDLIVRKASDALWSQIPTLARYGRDVSGFLERLGTFAREITFAPNAPYAPGVTGIGISSSDARFLGDPTLLASNPVFRHIANVIASCIAHNLLEPVPNQQQGKPGKTWLVLYLNRLLCVRFDLPLHYGGWRHKSLRDLAKWLPDSPSQHHLEMP